MAHPTKIVQDSCCLLVCLRQFIVTQTSWICMLACSQRLIMPLKLSSTVQANPAIASIVRSVDQTVTMFICCSFVCAQLFYDFSYIREYHVLVYVVTCKLTKPVQRAKLETSFGGDFAGCRWNFCSVQHFKWTFKCASKQIECAFMKKAFTMYIGTTYMWSDFNPY